jgi:hypothetical protein
VVWPRFTSPEPYTPKHLAEKILTSKGALEGERKQITVLFADLKGSMELLADRDPEEARTLLDPVLEHMMEAVHRDEGTVNQVMGDGIMALFGAPLAHEDHAVRACYLALRMQESVRQYAEGVRRAAQRVMVHQNWSPRVDASRTARPRARLAGTPRVNDQSVQALRVSFERVVDGVGDRLGFVPAEAGRDQDDPRVCGVRGDGLRGQPKKVDDVGRGDGTASSRRHGELRPVVELNGAHVMRADRLHALLPQDPTDNRGQVLVEIDLHPVVMKRTSPG